MNDEQRERVAKRLALLKAHAPHSVEFVRRLYELGMIDGWRAIERVDIKEKGNEPAAARV